jgi:RNA polymerase sigma-70 factor (ECF subfamily)
MSSEIQQLVNETRNGSETAARQLVDLLYPTILRIVRNHLPRREQEEDLTQEVFLRVFSRLHQYRENVPLVHWVSRIAVNTCIDQLRKQKHRPEFRWSDFSEEQQAVLNNLVGTTGTEPGISPEDAREVLHRLMLHLNANERIVVQWLYLEEKTVAEICDLTGWKSSKVKVTAFRARQKLSAALQRL